MAYGKRWKYSEVPESFISQQDAYHRILLRCLWIRGIQGEDALRDFLDASFEDNHDPFLFRDMQKTVDRIMLANQKNEKIFIYGDYDADGVSAASLLATTFQQIGISNFDVYLPHREKDGYGLNIRAIDEIILEKGKLIITCDCGISNGTEVAYANSQGVEVIITDHHTLPSILPEAYSILHCSQPHETYPFQKLSGGGVAYKLAQALLRKNILDPQQCEAAEKWLLDLVAISTVADMVPLIGENRILVKFGLKVIEKAKRLGLKVMMESAGIDFSSVTPSTVGFQIAPRINAAGRIDHSNIALQLLLSKNEEEAKRLAAQLESNNNERRSITEDTFLEACQQIESRSTHHSFQYAFDEKWILGVVGLVAGKLAQKYTRPTFVLGAKDDLIVGSGRSVNGFDLMQILHAHKDLLEKFGGHSMACGFSLKKENFSTFIQSVEKFVDEHIQSDQLVPSIDIDAKLHLRDIHWDLFNDLERLQPYGMGNSQPVFSTEKIEVKKLRSMGKNNEHCRFFACQEGIQYPVVGFSLGAEAIAEIQEGSILHIAYILECNEWNGKKDLQLRLLDYTIQKDV